jgi:hypothetical protein
MSVRTFSIGKNLRSAFASTARMEVATRATRGRRAGDPYEAWYARAVRRAAVAVLVLAGALASACQSLAGLSAGETADGGAATDTPDGGESADASADSTVADDSAPGDAASGASSDADLGERLIFVTSTDYAGDLGGIAGANAKCQARANAALLPGTYLAWIAAFGEASIPVRMTHSPLAYRLKSGVTVALNFDGLVGLNLLSPVNVTELGSTRALQPVWTNTNPFGQAQSSLDCNGWTSAAPAGTGQRDRTDVPSLTSQQFASCDQVAALFCVQQ